MAIICIAKPAQASAAIINNSSTNIKVERKLLLAQSAVCRCPPRTDKPRDPLAKTDIPYIISPRRTLLLDNKPKIRWNQVTNAAGYTVSILAGEKEIWTEQVSGTEVIYPGKPALEPGIDYLVIVKTKGQRSSQEEKVTGLSFRLLSAKDAEDVRTSLALLKKQQLTDTVKSLLQTHLYVGYYLRSEAIETLEKLVAGGAKEAVIYRLLGDLYQQVGLTEQAEGQYLEAIKWATAPQDLQVQAAAKAGLGELYASFSNKEKQAEGLSLLRQALDIYKKSGDMQRVKELEKRISGL
ncbi:tetratricopeptide repeat protein [Anabaena sphaerica FACHB-251]|uniref:Tetratricopeptide repeat protein n=1 Tax=Anabaena sphaerica FACHB-251 TaxID=2692883 RepID=A0A927A3P8_9NOST|nr:tetratricopeptide repeat protein [Anabaena sphaerica]MBD2296944.1 tetratricopeptide repeat protein [Anabaena sphaerica FACHB-251]